MAPVAATSLGLHPAPPDRNRRSWTRPSAGLIRGDDRRAVARLDDPDDGRSVRLWVDDGYRYLMVYTADQVGRPERRRTAVAVEPMTCPPDAFRSGTDLIELDPGESWHGSWGLQAAPLPAADGPQLAD